MTDAKYHCVTEKPKLDGLHNYGITHLPVYPQLLDNLLTLSVMLHHVMSPLPIALLSFGNSSCTSKLNQIEVWLKLTDFSPSLLTHGSGVRGDFPFSDGPGDFNFFLLQELAMSAKSCSNFTFLGVISEENKDVRNIQ